MTSPHVFVTMADILNLECDAWLLPTDSFLSIRRHWLSAHRDLQKLANASCGNDFRAGRVLAQAIRNWDQQSPQPVLTAVPHNNVWGPHVVAERLEAFVVAAKEALGGRSSRRPYPLLAIPFFGTAGGGAGQHLGAALRDILDCISDLSSRYSIDVVLVLRDRAAFSLAQKLRREALAKGCGWAPLNPQLQGKAITLGEKAKAGHLVPFLGAGISVSAGAPTWGQLLERLRDGIDLNDAADVDFSRLGPLDHASVLEQMYVDQNGSRSEFENAVADLVDLPRYGLAPALLATLPSAGAITLNYDRLFEMACADAQRPRTVLPENVPTVGGEWLLKLHGSVSKPETIVLTRDDYLGFNSTRAALSALVKAHLLTHHLLFVGFGLADDHFHEIVHDVRQALSSHDPVRQQMGTVLSLFNEPHQRLVWSGKLDILPMAGRFPDGNMTEEERNAARQEAGRDMEIFLDMTAAYAADDHSYLLAPAYTQGLSEDEVQLRRHLLALAKHHQTPATAEVWGVISKTLINLGFDPDATYTDRVNREN
ncbi:SIR2 family protein [Paenarthrobacter aromaticivorans]|uniref:SIR2 family protein n=1 Tax=Paenarthrobacter aromaticivorans TaxID=2849150 RepID=A0ABS6I4G5_9MICC|nr:SIR2 family protein [Paenarthrobacter sp. MMS21-TAE1-1]MBU8866622.1 SIR2 family protein [Paenarthrobacter sp. MMS21-TAE1-1]